MKRKKKTVRVEATAPPVQPPMIDTVIGPASGFSEGQTRALAEQFNVRTRNEVLALGWRRIWGTPLLLDAARILGLVDAAGASGAQLIRGVQDDPGRLVNPARGEVSHGWR